MSLGKMVTRLAWMEQRLVSDKVGFGGLLEGQHRGRLEAESRPEVLGQLADKALEGEFADEQLGRLLVATDLAKGDSAGPVVMGLLHTTSGGGRLAGGLGDESLSGSLATSGLARSLLRVCHFFRFADLVAVLAL